MVTPPAIPPVPPAASEKGGGGAGKLVALGVAGLLVIAAAVVLLLGFAVGPKWFVEDKKGDGARGAESAESDSKGSRESDTRRDGGKKDGMVPDIVVPLPPGWQEASHLMGMDFGEMFEGGIGGEVAMDSFFTDSSMTNMIIAMHMDSGGTFSLPTSDMTLEEMEEYIEENREELLDEFSSGLLSGGMHSDIYKISAFQTRSGDVGAEITFDLQEGEDLPVGVGADVLLFFKGQRIYMVMVMSMSGTFPGDTVRFLKENIHFK